MRARARGLFAGMLPVAVAVAAVAGAPPARAAGSPGTIATAAGGPGRGLVHNVAQEANWVATAPDSSVYVSDVQGVVRQFNDTSTWEKAIAGVGVVTGYGGDGGLATRARLGLLGGLALDQDKNVLIADVSNNRIRMIAATSGTFYGVAVTAGDLYTVAGAGTSGFAGDGGPATAAGLRDPQGVTADPSGNLVIADSFDNRVRVVAAASGTFYGVAMSGGDIYTVAGNGTAAFAGDGGPATAAELFFPNATIVDGAGNLVIADFYNNRARVVAATSGSFYGQAMTAGDIYTVAGTGRPFESGNTGKAVDAELSTPSAIAVDGPGSGAGNYALLDYAEVRLVATTSGTFFGQSMSPGRIYGIAGNGRPGYTGDGGPATAARVGLPPGGVAFDGSGNLLLADAGNNRIRVIAAGSGSFYGQPMTLAHIYTVAGDGTAGSGGDGGPAASAELNGPQAVTVDGAGDLVIADTGNDRIRVVAAASGTFYGQAMTAGHIYTVAGTGAAGYSGDGGPATAATLRTPTSVTADAAGNLLIADSANNRIRAVAATSGSFYGQAMTAGDIYTVAGNGTYGFAGDGDPAASAELRDPMGVSFDGSGNLLILDGDNGRIRRVGA